MNSIFFAGIVGPVYLALGLSALFYIKEWEKLVKDWEKNHYNLFFWAITELILGLILIQKHNIWGKGPFIIITLTGWGMLLESLTYLILPGKVIKSWFKTFNNPGFFRLFGILFIIVGGYLSYLAYLA